MRLTFALYPIVFAFTTAFAGVTTRPASVRACDDTSASGSSFEFASNPWLNLYNFLLKDAKLARGMDDEGLGARGYVYDDTAAARPLSNDEAKSWKRAVTWFASDVLTDRLQIDSLVINVNNVLARTRPNDDLDAKQLHPLLRQVLREVMPIYRSAWWPSHRRRNEEWIESMRSALEQGECSLARRAETVFRAPWPNGPIPVDATVYANWFGAYSTREPTRITVSANAQGSQGGYGLEVLLHETAHSMLGPLDSALQHEAVQQHKRLPPELAHLILFYTAGALIKEQKPSHVPFAEAFGIWRRNDGTRAYRELIAREWQPYLSGTRSFAAAVTEVVRQLD